MRLAWLLIYLLSLPITAIGLETIIFKYNDSGELTREKLSDCDCGCQRFDFHDY